MENTKKKIKKYAIYKHKKIYVRSKDAKYFYVNCIAKYLPDDFFVELIRVYPYEWEGKIPINQENQIEYLYTLPGWDDLKEGTKNQYSVKSMALYKNKRIYVDSIGEDYYIAGFFGSKPPDGLFQDMKELAPLEFWGKIPISEKDQIKYLDDIKY